jgi:hypothetical protein
VGRLAFDQRLFLAGEPPSDADVTIPVELWSRYKAEHPWALSPEVEMRLLPADGARLGVWGRAVSNASLGAYPVDHLDAGLSALAPVAGAVVAAGAEVQWRLADDHRDEPYRALLVDASLGRTVWLARDVGIEAQVAGRIRTWDGQSDVLLRLRAYASRARGFADVRPSRTVGRTAAEEGRDRSPAGRLGPEG